MTLFFLSIAIILVAGVAALLLFKEFHAARLASVVGLSAGCGLGLYDAVSKLVVGGDYSASVDYLANIPLAFKLNSLSAFFLMAIFAVCLLATIYSYHYMNQTDKPERTAVNYFFFSLLIAAMALVVVADNTITFMLCWELMSLSSFFLVIYKYESAENRRAGYLYLVYSQVGAMFLLAAFALGYSASGDFEFGAFAGLPDSVKILAFVLFFIGFGSKAGVFPFHSWLPHAHPAAPSHISAVMSGVMIKTGIFGILKTYTLLDLQSAVFGDIVLIAGMISGVLGVVYALGQHDIKRLLAYHSVENIGIILIGIGLGMIGVHIGNPSMAVLGFAGGLLHVLNHSIFKSLLFMGAGVVLQKTGTRSIDSLGGLLKTMRITGITFLIGSLAISGLPPLNGFVSEFFIYFGAFKGVPAGGLQLVLCLLAIISLALIGGLALACFTKVVGVVFQGEPRTEKAVGCDENGLAMLLPMMVLAGLCAVIGAYPKIFILAAIKATSGVGIAYGGLDLAPYIEMTGNITQATAIFFGLLLLILVARFLLFGKKTVTSSGTWGCGFTQPNTKMQYTGSSYAFSILEFFRPVAPLHEDHPKIEGLFPKKTHYHSHIDDVAEQQMSWSVVTPVQWLFDQLRWIQHGDIHLYIGYILLAIIVLLFFI